jgi:Family of unknown function (DUF5683)
LPPLNIIILPSIKNIICFISLILTFLFGTDINCQAQAVPDTNLNTIVPPARKDQIRPAEGTPIKIEPWQPNPKKAGLYSAVLPGAGQFYNQQYWKIPVIYAGVGAAIYFITYNEDNYRKYRKIYIARLQGDRSDGLPYTDQDIKTRQDEYKKDLDMTVLLTTVGFTLQIIDAITFAHLKNFDISKDISMRVAPLATPSGIGVGVVVHFK